MEALDHVEIKKLPEITTHAGLFAEILVHRDLGDNDKKIFDIVDYDTKFVDKSYFESTEFTIVNLSRVFIYEQLEDVNCSPVEVFNSIGNIKDIAFDSYEYIEKIVEEHRVNQDENEDKEDYKDLLYLNGFGTFFIYKNKNKKIILAQVNLSDDSSLEVTFFRYEDYKAPISGVNRARFVVFVERVLRDPEKIE